MSRPRKQQNEKKSRSIIFRLSEDDYIPLRDMAARAGMKANALARLQTLKGSVTFAAGKRMDAALVAELNHIGNNLNQLVGYGQAYGLVVPGNARTLRDRIEDLVLAAVDDVDAAFTKRQNGKKTRHVFFRVSEDDYTRLCATAAKGGLSVNALARELTVSGAATLTTAGRIDAGAIEDINRLGHTLNRLVKKAHMRRALVPETAEALCFRIEERLVAALAEADA